MRISDWSSDVCSSDLAHRAPLEMVEAAPHRGRLVGLAGQRAVGQQAVVEALDQERAAALDQQPDGVARDGGGTKRTRRRLEGPGRDLLDTIRSEEHTSELQSLMRNSYAVFCLKK